MLCCGSWPEEQWRCALNEEEEKKLRSSFKKGQKWKWGKVIHMVSGDPKGLKVQEKSGVYRVSDACVN